MRKLLAVFIAVGLVMVLFAGGCTSTPKARVEVPVIVNLGTVGNFVVLAKAGISTTGTTHVTGDIGVSPAAASAITGFALVADPTNVFSKSSQVTGKVYAATYGLPTPANMSTAISNMQAAYVNAATRTPATGASLNIGDGTVAGQTLAPGLYTWGTNVTITTDLTLKGSANDVWIFQISGTLNLAIGKSIILTGGAQAANIFWAVGGAVTLYPNSHFEGNILAKTNIAMQKGASINGRLLAQTGVALVGNTVGLVAAPVGAATVAPPHVVAPTVRTPPVAPTAPTTGGR